MPIPGLPIGFWSNLYPLNDFMLKIHIVQNSQDAKFAQGNALLPVITYHNK